ncbi:MAG: acyl-CoA dehydrogenase family protein [Pirellula sp.]
MKELAMELCGNELSRAIRDVTGLRSAEWLAEIRGFSRSLKTAAEFPIETLRRCSAIEHWIGGDNDALLRYYVWLASGCLTTAFISTQRNAAIRRMETSSNHALKNALLPSVVAGSAFVTVGISHLTTSRQHLSKAPLQATPMGDGWLLDGYCPWVTGGFYAKWLVVGAVERGVELDTVDTDSTVAPRELLFAIPGARTGIIVETGADLMALTASATGQVRFENVVLNPSEVLHGPIANVMTASGMSGGAGGLQTSALAIGHAAQAIEYLLGESKARPDLRAVANGFVDQCQKLLADLLALAKGEPVRDAGELRKSANDLALNSTQAALIAAKGAGFTNDHDVGRWCRESLFFLVWSCPHAVAQSHLCSFLT